MTQDFQYCYALGSAAECSAALDLLEIKGMPVDHGHKLLSRVGAMLYGITRSK